MGNISPLVVLFFLCVLFSLLTFVIPGGAFERKTIDVMGHARSIVVPGSFHYVPSVPQGFSELWTVFMRGAIEAADRSFVILLSAGAMTAVIATGAIDAAIDDIMGKNADKVAEYRGGKDKLLGFFVGQVMKATGGKANPALLNERLKAKLAG